MSDNSPPLGGTPWPIVFPGNGSPVATSSEIGTLAKALASAQKAFPVIPKNRTAKVSGTSKQGKPYEYTYAYADLSDIFQAIRAPLAEHGLAVVQPIAFNDRPVLVTRVIHESGEWIESTYPLTQRDNPQEQGSVITYARRYALTALLGIVAEEDDDAQSASRKPGAKDAPTKGRAATPTAPPKPAGPDEVNAEAGSGKGSVTLKAKQNHVLQLAVSRFGKTNIEAVIDEDSKPRFSKPWRECNEQELEELVRALQAVKPL